MPSAQRRTGSRAVGMRRRDRASNSATGRLRRQPRCVISPNYGIARLPSIEARGRPTGPRLVGTTVLFGGGRSVPDSDSVYSRYWAGLRESGCPADYEGRYDESRVPTRPSPSSDHAVGRLPTTLSRRRRPAAYVRGQRHTCAPGLTRPAAHGRANLDDRRISPTSSRFAVAARRKRAISGKAADQGDQIPPSGLGSHMPVKLPTARDLHPACRDTAYFGAPAKTLWTPPSAS